MLFSSDAKRKRQATEPAGDSTTSKQATVASVLQRLVQEKDSAFEEACRSGDVEKFHCVFNQIMTKAQSMLSEGDNPLEEAREAIRQYYQTRPRRGPLHWAVLSESAVILRFLLSTLKLNPNVQDEHKISPLVLLGFHTARGSNECYEALLRAGADPNLMCGGYSAFHVAVRHGAMTPTLIMLQNGAELLLQQEDRQSVFHLAVRAMVNLQTETKDWQFSRQNEEIDDVLLERKSGEHTEFLVRYRCLHNALFWVQDNKVDKSKLAFSLFSQLSPEERQRGLLRILLNHAKRTLDEENLFKVLNHAGVNEETPLARAIGEEDPEMVDELLMYGADPLFRGRKDDFTVLEYACKQASLEVVQALLRCPRAKEYCLSKAGPLILSVLGGNQEVYTELLKIVDPNSRGAYGKTAMHTAASQDDVRAILTLLQHKADMNAADDGGNTPLHIAAVEGASKAIEWLLKKGADAAVRNKQSHLACELAKEPAHRVLFTIHEHRHQIAAHESTIGKLIAGTQLDQRHFHATCCIVKLCKGVATGTGTGFVLQIHDDLVMVTNYHVVENGDALSVFPCPLSAPAIPSTIALERVFCDAGNDLACFKLSECVPPLNLSFLSLADGSFPIHYGQTLHVLGYPAGYPTKTALYTSCCFGGELEREGGRLRIILTGGGIYHGNSGGPLIAMSAERRSSVVFGVIVGIQKEDERAYGISEAIPYTIVESFLKVWLASQTRPDLKVESHGRVMQ